METSNEIPRVYLNGLDLTYLLKEKHILLWNNQPYSLKSKNKEFLLLPFIVLQNEFSNIKALKGAENLLKSFVQNQIKSY